MTSAEPNRPMMTSRLASLLTGTMAVLVGVAVLAGWALDIGALKSVLPGWVAVKPNTALAFILIGIAMLFSRPPSTLNLQLSTAFSRVSRLCAVLAGLIGFLTLCEVIFHWDPGFDQWLFREPPGAEGTSIPGRMAPEAALCFVLLAGAVWMTGGPRQSRGALLASAIVGLVVTALACSALLTYATPVLGAFGWWGLTIMAVPTAATFAALGLAVLSVTWQQGQMSWALSKKITVLFGCGLALLVTIGLNNSRSQVQLRESGRKLAQSEEVLGGITTIMSEVAHAQNHARGFVITGDERFLKSYLAAVANCRDAIAAQRRLSAGDPVHQRQFARLEPQVMASLQWFQQVINASRAGMTDATRREMIGHGEDLMENLRATVRQIESEDHSAIEQLKQEAESVTKLTYSVISAGTIATLAIFLGALFGLNRAAASRQKAESDRARLAAIVEFSDDAIIGKDLNGIVTSWNEGAEKLFGYSAGEMVGTLVTRLIPPDRQEEEVEIMRWIHSGEGVNHFETVRLTKEGRSIDISVTVSAIRDATGQIVGASKVARDITERKQAEKALRETNEYLDSLLNHANAPIVVWDADGKITRFNHAFEEIAGLKAEQVLGKGLDLLFAEDQRERAMEIVRRAGAGERFNLVEVPIHHPSGSQRTVLWNSAPIFGADKEKQIATIAQGQDITERKQAEAALLDSEERFRTMANSIAQLAWIARADGFIFWYNQRWYDYTGTTPEQMEGWGWQSVHDPKALPSVMENWTGAIAAGQPFEMEFPLRGADGQFRTFLTRGQPLKDAEGRVVQWFGTNTDVEALKQAEEVLRDANLLLERRVVERTAELARGKQLLDEAGRLARVGGWEIDLERNALSWSDMVREIHEVGAEFRPTVETALKFYAPESIPVITAAVQRAIEEGQPYDVELQLISAKGSRLWVRAIGQPYRERGKVVKIVGVFQDITVFKQNAEELRRNRDDLAAANKELEAFSYSVSHDLRAPLRSIDGFSRILLEDYAAKLDDDGRDSLNRIRSASQRMAQLIDDMLNLSRVSRAEMHREQTDLSAMTRDVAAELQRQEPGRLVEFTVAGGIVAEGDPALLRVVLENLLGNAWKFTGKRERALIEFGAVAQEGRTAYFVRDNGAGFDAKFAGKLFGAFQRLHSSADFPGTGIGLATVQRIVHRHGGRVWAEGEVNKGATFYFNLGARA